MTSIDFDRPNNVIHTCLGKVFGDEGFRVDQLNQQAHINKVTELESWGLLSAAKQRAFCFGQLIQPIRELNAICNETGPPEEQVTIFTR